MARAVSARTTRKEFQSPVWWAKPIGTNRIPQSLVASAVSLFARIAGLGVTSETQEGHPARCVQKENEQVPN